jgi:MFS family permease
MGNMVRTVSTHPLMVGFDTATIGGLQAMPGFLAVYGFHTPAGFEISTKVQQLIASLLAVGSIVGCLTTGFFAQKFGRKAALWFGCAVAYVAIAIQLGSTNLAGLYAGRVILGFSNAYFITFSNVFISEIAPHHLRAILIAFFGFWVTFWTVIGNVVDFLTKGMLSKLSYRIPLACNFFIPTVVVIGLFFIEESPRWLVLQGRSHDARQSITWYRGSKVDKVALEEELVEIERGIQEEKELAQGVSVLDLFRAGNLRRTLICWGAVASHAATGVFVLISFNTYLPFQTLSDLLDSSSSKRDFRIPSNFPSPLVSWDGSGLALACI